MTVKKKVLNRGRVIFADWMPTAKNCENKATAGKKRFTVIVSVEHSICAAGFTDIIKFTDWYEV